MTRTDLVKYVSEKVGLTQAGSDQVIQAVLDGILEGCKDGGDVTLRKFGKFRITTRPSRTVHVGFSKDKSVVTVPKRNVLFFKAAKSLTV